MQHATLEQKILSSIFRLISLSDIRLTVSDAVENSRWIPTSIDLDRPHRATHFFFSPLSLLHVCRVYPVGHLLASLTLDKWLVPRTDGALSRSSIRMVAEGRRSAFTPAAYFQSVTCGVQRRVRLLWSLSLVFTTSLRAVCTSFFVVCGCRACSKYSSRP